jgi:biopolymer transport protein ExbD
MPNGKANTITISATDQIGWNDAPISRQDLRYLLNRTQKMRPAPELHLRPDARARYGTVDEVLAMIKRANVQKFGFVGNEAYATP